MIHTLNRTYLWGENHSITPPQRYSYAICFLFTYVHVHPYTSSSSFFPSFPSLRIFSAFFACLVGSLALNRFGRILCLSMSSFKGETVSHF